MSHINTSKKGKKIQDIDEGNEQAFHPKEKVLCENTQPHKQLEKHKSKSWEIIPHNFN